MIIDDVLVPALITLGLLTLVAVPYVAVAILRHSSQAALDSYGKYRGTGPAKSFVCPACLTRSYAPSHIAARYCSRCQRNFPEAATPSIKIKTWTP